ncbi:MAG: FG-GAP-like repeat-containing protein [Chloroflexota bacterium]
MKTKRYFYLGVIGVVACVLVGVLLGSFSGDAGVTAVSSPSSHSPEQVIVDDGWVTAVSAHLKAAEYAISASQGAVGQPIVYQAPNRAQNLRTYFSETGIQVTPRLAAAGAWQAALEVLAVGNGVQTTSPRLAAHEAVANRVTLDYGAWQAWYVNDVRGVEQGFTIEEPLFAQETGLLHIDLAVTGDLSPRSVSDDEVQLVTAVGEQALIYHNQYAYDAHGAELPAKMELATLPDNQSGIRLVVDVTGADYPIVVDSLLFSGIIWETWLEQDANYGFSVSTAGDVNGDGYDDVLVGANWFDGGEPREGAVFAYYGGPQGLPHDYQWKVEGNASQLELGYAVKPAGDVNGDGYADIIVGAYATPTGKALVYAGSPAGLEPFPLWFAEGEQAGDRFGMAVNTAGDVNNDGFDDVIIGAPYYDDVSIGQDSGRAYVFYGPLSGAAQSPDWIGTGGWPDVYNGGLFGYAVSTAGDVNNDDYDDVIIGEPLAESDGVTGLAAIFGGSPDGLFMPVSGEPATRNDAEWVSFGAYASDSWFGGAVGYAGDVNGDGYDDVVVGAPYYPGNQQAASGAVFVFTGMDPIFYMQSSPAAEWTFTVDAGNALLGYAVGAAGDVDNDGFDDVIAGAPQYDNSFFQPAQAQAVNGGAAFILRGTGQGFGTVWEFSSNEAEARLGTSVGAAGDVNGDGYADVIIGAPQMPSPADTLGEAFALFGSGEIRELAAFNDSPTSLGSPTQFGAEAAAGGALDFLWNFGDGTVAPGAFVAHTYEQPGLFTAVLTATSFTDQVTATTAVTVSESTLIDPTNGGSLAFVNDETGFGTKVDVPPGAVSETLKLSYTPLAAIPQPSPTNTLGYYFDLDVDLPDYQLFLPVVVNGDDGGTVQGVETAVVQSITDGTSYKFAKPVTVTIVYSDTGLTPEQELRLKLPYWNKESQMWIDIAEECGLADTYIYYPDENYFTVQICHLTRFGVVH